MLGRREKIIELSRAVQATFSYSEWTEIGYLTDTYRWIDSHPRLLRSLYWGDDDYKGHVMDAVAYILDRSPKNLKLLVEYEPVAQWLKENRPGVYEELKAEMDGLEVPDAVRELPTEAGLAALADAQTLLRERGPTSAVDRVHTGLHAFLRAACDKAGIQYPKDCSASQLLRLLIDQHPSLAGLGPHSEHIRRIIRTSASIVDTMGALRNRASLAHPNEELLRPDEAQLAINLAWSLLRYLGAKLGET